MSELKPARVVPCGHCGGVGTVEVPAEVNTIEAYYFGCWGEIGHYWHRRGGRRVSVATVPLPFRIRFDGTLAPDRDAQIEGHAALHQLDISWTVLGWWDRSVDSRGGSNSALFARGALSFESMLEIAKVQFPGLLERQRVPIRLVEDKTRGLR